MYDKLNFFKLYFENASEKTILLELLDKRFIELPDPLVILDLGCHDGALMQRILDRYQDRLPKKVNLIGVDPVETAVEAFMSREFGPNVVKQGFIGSAETYLETFQQHHHWIFASQCLYWSENLPDTLMKMRMKSDFSLVVLRGKRGIYEIQSKFKKLLGNKNERLYSADDIEEALLSLSIPFEREDKKTIIFFPDANSLNFKWLILFFLQTSQMSRANYNKIKDYLLQSHGESMEHDVSYFWFNYPFLSI